MRISECGLPNNQRIKCEEQFGIWNIYCCFFLLAVLIEETVIANI